MDEDVSQDDCLAALGRLQDAVHDRQSLLDLLLVGQFILQQSRERNELCRMHVDTMVKLRRELTDA